MIEGGIPPVGAHHGVHLQAEQLLINIYLHTQRLVTLTEARTTPVILTSSTSK